MHVYTKFYHFFKADVHIIHEDILYIGLMMATGKKFMATIIHGQERESTASYGTGANNRHI